MDLTDIYRNRIGEWLIQNRRRCPKCNASAEFLKTVSVREGLHRDAATPHGIDTSMEATIAQIKCDKCGYDNMELTLEDAGLI